MDNEINPNRPAPSPNQKSVNIEVNAKTKPKKVRAVKNVEDLTPESFTPQIKTASRERNEKIAELKAFGAQFSQEDWTYMVKNQDFIKFLDENNVPAARELAKRFLCKIP
jgi:hypothetical protein